jgi:hypothetical protein
MEYDSKEAFGWDGMGWDGMGWENILKPRGLSLSI